MLLKILKNIITALLLAPIIMQIMHKNQQNPPTQTVIQTQEHQKGTSSNGYYSERGAFWYFLGFLERDCYILAVDLDYFVI